MEQNTVFAEAGASKIDADGHIEHRGQIEQNQQNVVYGWVPPFDFQNGDGGGGAQAEKRHQQDDYFVNPVYISV